jgi:hypothetical protein
VQANDDYVLKVLEEIGLVSRKQIAQARAKLNGAPAWSTSWSAMGSFPPTTFPAPSPAQAQMHWIDLSAVVIPPEIIAQISAADARRFKVIPVTFGESGLVLAISDPLDVDTIDSLNFPSSTRPRAGLHLA